MEHTCAPSSDVSAVGYEVVRPYSWFFAQVWAAWVDPHNKPVRACIAAPMAHPDILVEVMVTAAKLKRSERMHRFPPPPCLHYFRAT